MAENKMQPTDVPVEDFLSSVSEQRRAEAHTLITMMQEISGEPPVMWGPSIIGFGAQHYKSEAGTEGDMGLLGFSPRKASLTVYFYEGFNHYGQELAQLGKHTTSMGCLYISKLADVDLTVLRGMLEHSYQLATTPKKPLASVDEYIASVPQPARVQFDALRAIVTSESPQAREVVSYGILGYKVDDKRARVFISGWKDHVALYPIPKSESLKKELAPHIRGKGTLWFTLSDPLPEALIRKVVKELSA